MGKQILLLGVLIILLAANRLDAGSDSGISNRFSLGKTNRVISTPRTSFGAKNFKVSVGLKNGRFMFSTENHLNTTVTGIFAVNGRRVAEPVMIKPGVWCWSPDAHISKQYGAGYYLAVFNHDKTCVTIPIVVEHQ